MAKAAELRGEKHRVVAVIGDGSMTGGLAFEGLNNAGASKRTNLLVILNDNNMAIDQATGRAEKLPAQDLDLGALQPLQAAAVGLLSHTPRLLRLCQKAGNAVKQGLLNKSNLFESLNFRYFGPVDGHNLKELVRTLRALRDIEGPKLLHVMTVKGRLPSGRAQPARLARSGAVQSRYGRADFGSGRRGALSGRIRRNPAGAGPPRRARRGRHARHAVGLFDEHPAARDARSLFRRGHRRGACRDFLGGTRRRGHGALLQYLFDLHAAGLRQCDPRCRHSGSSGGDVSRPGRSGRRGRA